MRLIVAQLAFNHLCQRSFLAEREIYFRTTVIVELVVA
jgi:hypothetical protein